MRWKRKPTIQNDNENLTKKNKENEVQVFFFFLFATNLPIVPTCLCRLAIHCLGIHSLCTFHIPRGCMGFL
jgi:hypothetical protein